MTDDFATKVAVSILAEVFKEAVRGVKDLSGLLDEKAKGKDYLGRAAATYQGNLRRRYNVMRIFGMPKPVPLESIYTRVNVLERVTATRRESVEQLSELLRHQRRFGQIDESKPGISAVNQLPRFVLLGKPGSGKTTFLKYVALRSLDDVFERKLVPIIVSLKALSDSDSDVSGFIFREFETSGVPDAEPFALNLLRKGKCRLLLDGLDEVSDARRDTLISEINTLSDRYPDNQFIISCRVAAYNYSFEKFSDVEMADFGDQEVRSFLSHWWPEHQGKATECWETIKKVDGLREMAATPLLLTLLCLAYEDSLDLSSNRAELYKDAIEALLKKWDSSRNIRRDEVYRQLTPKRKEDLFCELAAEAFERERYFFKREQLEGSIARILRRFCDSDEAALHEMSQATLQCIKSHHGLIVERSKDIDSFSHLTFQEYFTARYISLHGPESQRALVRDYLRDIRWREVIVLVACLLPDAEDFVTEILRQMVAMGYSNGPLSRVPRTSAPERKGIGWGGKDEVLTIRPHSRGAHLSVVVRDLPERMERVEHAIRLERTKTLSHRQRLLRLQREIVTRAIFAHEVAEEDLEPSEHDSLILSAPAWVSPEVYEASVRAYWGRRMLRFSRETKKTDDLITVFSLTSRLVVETDLLKTLAGDDYAALRQYVYDMVKTYGAAQPALLPEPLASELKSASARDAHAVGAFPGPPIKELEKWCTLFCDEGRSERILTIVAELEKIVREGKEAAGSSLAAFRWYLNAFFTERGDRQTTSAKADVSHTARAKRLGHIQAVLDGPLACMEDNARGDELQSAFSEDCDAIIRLLTNSVVLDPGEKELMLRRCEDAAARVVKGNPEVRLSTAETLLEILRCPVVLRREVRVAALETIMSLHRPKEENLPA